MRYAFFGSNGRVVSAINDVTASELPAGAIELTAEQFDDRFNLFLDGDELLVVPFSIERDDEIVAAMIRSMEFHMDAVAQSDGWDNRWTCVARAGYSNPWQAKAVAFGGWMDACWEHAIQVQADVLAGNRAAPTEAELIAELPQMVWPS